MLNVIMLNVVMPNVVMVNIVMLNVTMLGILAPKINNKKFKLILIYFQKLLIYDHFHHFFNI
jgi:hypothetical protein